MVKVYVPAVDAVPDNTPVVVLSVTPGGNVPLDTANVKVLVLPVTVMVWL